MSHWLGKQVMSSFSSVTVFVVVVVVGVVVWDRVIGATVFISRKNLSVHRPFFWPF